MADATAVFKYGQYELSHVLTRGFEHIPVYDPSGTDYLYTKFILRVQGVIHPNLDPVNTGETAAEAIKRIEHDFLSPRQYLLYSQNGKTVLEVPAGRDGLYVDAENGPKPRLFNVTLITQMSMMVEFTVEVCKIDCSSSVAARRGYTSNRWSESEEYNEKGFCSLTTRGLLICASDLRVNPDSLRDVVAPVIRRGYQRERSSYTLSEDGLRLSYAFTDREYYLGPPYPALKASGKFAVIQSPGTWFAQCSVRLEGSKDASKQQLMEVALGVVRSKIGSVVPSVNGKATPPVVHATYSEDLYANAVDVSFRASLDPKRLGTTATGARTDIFGTDLPGSPSKYQPGIAPSLRGNNQFLMLLSQSFDDPCVMSAMLTNGLSESVLASAGATAPLGEASLSQSGGSIQDAISRGAVAAASASAVATAQYQTQVAGATPVRPPGAGDVVATYAPRVLNVPPRQGTNPASIVVGKIPDPPTVSAYDSDIPYEHYQITLKTVHRSGYRVLPSSWDGQPNRKVRVHNNALTLVAEWTAERIGSAPEIPDPCPGADDSSSDTCSNFVLEETGFGVDGIEPVANGGYLYRISGRYVYGVLDTTLVPLVAPLPPFVVAEVRQKIDAANGRLYTNVKTSYERQIEEINRKISQHNAVIGGLIGRSAFPSDFPVNGVIDLVRVEVLRENITRFQKQKAELLARMEAELNAISSTQTKRRREGDYLLNKDLIWFRLKTVKPGPIFEDCECDGTEEGFEGVLTGGNGSSQAALTGTPRTLPSP